MTNEEMDSLKRELDALGDGEPYVERAVGTLPLREGIKLLEQLDKEFRPYLIKYTALINKTRKYIPVTPAQLEPFKQLAEQLKECEVKGIANYGYHYLTAINCVTNGHEFDIENLIMNLYFDIQFTKDVRGAIALYTPKDYYSKADLTPYK